MFLFGEQNFGRVQRGARKDQKYQADLLYHRVNSPPPVEQASPADLRMGPDPRHHRDPRSASGLSLDCAEETRRDREPLQERLRPYSPWQVPERGSQGPQALHQSEDEMDDN